MTRLGVIVALLLVGCAPQPTSSESSVTVYAAASLREAFEELAGAYAEETGVQVVLSFDSSSALRTQIEEGAPADVFASADLVNAKTLVDAGLTDGPAQTFAANALAIVVPVDDPAGVDDWTDLARSGLRVIAAGEEVPITRYAQELVDNLARRPDAPEGFADAYAANVLSREDNVRAVLAKIEVGEGDAAIVYETDAQSSADAASIAVPAEANVVAEYAVVALAGGGSRAIGFVSWLLAGAAQSSLAAHGFRPPP